MITEGSKQKRQSQMTLPTVKWQFNGGSFLKPPPYENPHASRPTLQIHLGKLGKLEWRLYRKNVSINLVYDFY